MKLFHLIEEGFIAKCPQKLLNFVQNLAILLSKTTGFCLISNRVVEDNLLMVLRIFHVTLVAIDIAILKILEQTWKLCVFVAKFFTVKVKIKKRSGDLFKFIFLKNLFDFSIL